MPANIYNARFVSDDDNPWDGNESYGMYTTPEAAQKAIQGVFRTEDDDCRWLPVGVTYTGPDANAKTWKLFSRESWQSWDTDFPLDENGECADDSGHGLYVIEEKIRYA